MSLPSIHPDTTRLGLVYLPINWTGPFSGSFWGGSPMAVPWVVSGTFGITWSKFLGQLIDQSLVEVRPAARCLDLYVSVSGPFPGGAGARAIPEVQSCSYRG